MSSWKEWRKRYKHWIRTMFEPSKKLRRTPKVGLLLASSTTKMYLPHYKHGGWQDGIPVQIKNGSNLVLVRLPAVKIGDRFLLLDGVHRMKELKPAMVLLDWVEYAKGDETCWLDLFNSQWRKWAK